MRSANVRGGNVRGVNVRFVSGFLQIRFFPFLDLDFAAIAMANVKDKDTYSPIELMHIACYDMSTEVEKQVEINRKLAAEKEELELKLKALATEKRHVVAERDALSRQVEVLHQKLICILCFEREKDSMVAPCGHACFCVACLKLHMDSERIRNRTPTCPVCRVAITRYGKMWL